MNDTKLKNLVTEAVALDRDIAEQTERLKLLKQKLISYADTCDRTTTVGGGSSVVLEGIDCIARVTQPADKLKSSVDAESELWNKLRPLLGGVTTPLFEPKVKYVPVETFRVGLMARFDKTTANKVIKLMTSKSSTTVSFETKEAS